MEQEIVRLIHPLTLKMHQPQLETEYKKVIVPSLVNQVRYAVVLGICFYALFAVLDFAVFPELAVTFIKIRLCVIPLLGVGFFLTFTDLYPHYARMINLLIIMISGAGVIIMELNGAANTNIDALHFYMFIIFFFLYSFYRMPFMDALFLGSLLMAAYLLIEWFLIGRRDALFLLHVMSMSGANIVGASVAYVLEYQSKKEFLLKKRLAESVIKDALTGLHNRHYFEQFLISDIENFIVRTRGIKYIERRLGDIKAAKYGLFMLDIDYFKRINDTFGHHSGDMVLKQFAGLLRRHTRKSDDILRVGGEEFMVVLKLTTDDFLIRFMKKIGLIIANHDFMIDGGRIIGCTVSVGLVIIPNPRTNDVSELVKYADRALYRSKDRGRNRGHRAYELQGDIEFEEIIWEDEEELIIKEA